MQDKRKTDLVTQALRSVGLRPQDFSVEKLGCSYQLFRYRIRQGRLTLNDYHLILLYTGRTWEELFPNPHVSHPQPIKLNLNPVPVSRPLPPIVKEAQQPRQPVQQVPVVAPSLKEEFKKEEVFKIEDVYGGGLPTDEQTVY